MTAFCLAIAVLNVHLTACHLHSTFIRNVQDARESANNPACPPVSYEGGGESDCSAGRTELDIAVLPTLHTYHHAAHKRVVGHAIHHEPVIVLNYVADLTTHSLCDSHIRVT